MILANAVIALLFALANYVYAYFGAWPHETIWNPFWLTFYTPNADDVGAQQPNFSLYFFFILLLVNVYFLIRLGRNRSVQAKNSSQRMILANALMVLFFVVCNLIYVFSGKDVYWDPLLLTSFTPGILDLDLKLPNFSFYFFWVLLLINIYFIIALGRKASRLSEKQEH